MSRPLKIPILPETTFRDVFLVLYRHKKKLIVFFLVTVIAVTLGTLVTPAVYQSEAMIFFRIGRESITTDPTMLGSVAPIINVGQARDAEIRSEIEILQSKDLAKTVVQKIGPEKILYPSGSTSKAVQFAERLLEPVSQLFDRAAGFLGRSPKDTPSGPDLEEAVLQFSDAMSLTVADTSPIIAITVEGFSPELAQKTLQQLLDDFLLKHIDVRKGPDSMDFFNQQAQHLKKQIDERQETLKELKIQSMVGSPKDAQGILARRIDRLQQSIEETEAALSASKAKIKIFKSRLDTLPKYVVERMTSSPNVLATRMQERLYELKIQEQRLSGKFLPGAPPLEQIHQEILKVESLLDELERTSSEKTEGINAVHQAVTSNLNVEMATFQSLAAKAATLRDKLFAAEAELQLMIDVESEVARQEREIQTLQENYLTYVKKMERARINRDLEGDKISNISIVQAPSLQTKKIRPKRVLAVLLGMIFGALGGMVLAFIAEYLDNTYKKPDEIESFLQVPVLASIPYIYGTIPTLVKGKKPWKKKTIQAASTQEYSETTTLTDADIAGHTTILESLFLKKKN